MQIFDIRAMDSYPYKKKEMDLIYNSEEFKMRIIKLPPGGIMPECRMPVHVIFQVIEGSVEITVDQEKATIGRGQCIISGPATVSMSSIDGAKLMGIQIPVGKKA